MTSDGYPNAHIRLQLTQRIADDPPRVYQLEIWLKDRRFHIRDLVGRRFDEVLTDVRAARQLGSLPRTIEEIMDRDAADRARQARPPAPTELYGDLDSARGWIDREHRDRVEVPASVLVPIAEQVLASGKTAGLQAGVPTTRLGRRGTRYDGLVEVTDAGEHYTNRVSRTIAPPYLMFERTEDANNHTLAFEREITGLDEGTVTDSDVIPPARAP